jgi:hypothetical protein
MLGDADPATKAALYANLGINLTYQHDRRTVLVEPRPTEPCASVCVGGGTPTLLVGIQPCPLDRVQGRTSCSCCEHTIDRGVSTPSRVARELPWSFSEN